MDINTRKAIRFLFLALVAILLAAVVIFMFMRVSDRLLDSDVQKDKSMRRDFDQMRKMASSGEYDKADKSMGEFFKKYGSVSDDVIKKSGLDGGDSKEAAQFEAALREENRARKYDKAISDAEKLSENSTSSPQALKEAEKALGLAKVDEEIFAAEDLIDKLKSSGSKTRPKEGLSDSDKARYASLFEAGLKCLQDEDFDGAVKSFDAAVSIQPTKEALDNLGRAAGMLEMKLRNSPGKK